MRQALIIFALTVCFSAAGAQEPEQRLLTGFNLGASGAWNDEKFNLAPSASWSYDFRVRNNYSIQFAPRYSWLYRWNEHYLSIPLHVRKRFGERWSAFAGPSLTWEIDNFRSFGMSGGIHYHISPRSSVLLSFYTFSLHRYHIDYFYIPVALSYNIFFLTRSSSE